MKPTLILFTSEYPFGKGEAYLESEIKYLEEAFGQIVIITNTDQLVDIRQLPSSIQVLNRPYELNTVQKVLSAFMIFSSFFWEELLFVIRQYKLPINRTIVNTILQSIYKSYVLERFLKDNLSNYYNSTQTLCYSYWADDNAVALALMKKRGFHFKAICRAHRWDVYFEKNGSGFLPFRKSLAENLSAIYFVAQNGLNYFSSKTRISSANMYLSRLGVYPLKGCKVEDTHFDLHLLSCSFVIDRKRVHKIAESLVYLNRKIKVKWTHIGSGPGMDSLRSICREIINNATNIQINLMGAIPNNQVKDFYKENYVDLFINVSESEGVPVSIMEAMSAGVPCMATDVDGVSEIVRDGMNGYLLPLTDDIKVIVEALEKFYTLPMNEKMILRAEAFETWNQFYNAQKNYESFVRSIAKLA